MKDVLARHALVSVCAAAIARSSAAHLLALPRAAIPMVLIPVSGGCTQIGEEPLLVGSDQALCRSATRAKEIHDGIDKPLQRFRLQSSNLRCNQIPIGGE